MAETRWVLLLAILLVPGAAARDAGSFLVEGSTYLPDGADVTFTPAVVFNNDTTRLQDFLLQAPRVRIHEFAKENVDVAAGDLDLLSVTSLPPSSGSRVREDVVITFSNVSERGFVGAYPGEGAQASLLALSRPVVQAQEGRRVDTQVSADGFDDREEDPLAAEPRYERILKEPHVWIEAQGHVSYGGPLLLKILGPDLVVTSSSHREEVFPTGVERSSPAQSTLRWVVLEAEAASLSMEALSTWTVAGVDASARWEGETIFMPTSGSLDSPRGRYVADDRLARVAGRFEGDFLPEATGDGLATRLILSGQVDRTTLHLQGASLAVRMSQGEGPLWLGGLALGLVAVAGLGVGAHAWTRQRGRAAPAARVEATEDFSVEDCMAAATKAADDEDWERAAHWLRRVRRMAPTSARTAADLAHALCQMGRHEEGLALYLEASRLSSDGEADFNGAVMAVEAGRPPEEVEAWLARALSRSPSYALDVEGDPAFRLLRGRAAFDRMLADAWARFEDGEPSGDAAAAGA